jgi:hypothetical protein
VRFKCQKHRSGQLLIWGHPIEHLFAKLKTFVKALRPDTLPDLVQAFCDAVKTVTPQNILKSFLHCGYEVEQ